MKVRKTEDFTIIPIVTIDWDGASKPLMVLFASILIPLFVFVAYLVIYCEPIN